MVCVTPSTQGNEDDGVWRLAFGVWRLAAQWHSQDIGNTVTVLVHGQSSLILAAVLFDNVLLDVRRRIARERVPTSPNAELFICE